MKTALALPSGLALLYAHTAGALDNGLARTPPMGWMTWERFRCVHGFPGQGLPDVCAEDPENCIDAKLITQHADILAQPEWRAAGYEYVNIDDCWSNMERTPNGTLAPNNTRFPAGMAALAAHVHGHGLKLGTYNDMGTKTCGGYPGECKDEVCSLPGYMDVDADTYASWGIDSLKMDGCNSVHNVSVLDPAYEHMGVALNRTGRPVMYSCSWPDYIRSAGLTVDYKLTAKHCNMWRMYNDIQDSWDSVTDIVDWVGDNAPHNGMIEAAGPGNWNDPDMLIIGNFALSHSQAQAQMALWCIMAAPLMMGNDLRHLDPAMKAILLAKEVIAIDQDALGVQGQRVAQDKSQCGAHDVWTKPLAGGDLAVVLWNRGYCGTHSKLSANWTTLGLPAGQKMAVRDLFLQKDLGTFVDSVSGFVDIDGVLMLRLATIA